MDYDIATQPELSLAWGVEVSVAQLVARILAYAESKASITTLKLVVKYSKIKPLGNLLLLCC